MFKTSQNFQPVLVLKTSTNLWWYIGDCWISNKFFPNFTNLGLLDWLLFQTLETGIDSDYEVIKIEKWFDILGGYWSRITFTYQSIIKWKGKTAATKLGLGPGTFPILAGCSTDWATLPPNKPSSPSIINWYDELNNPEVALYIPNWHLQMLQM